MARMVSVPVPGPGGHHYIAMAYVVIAIYNYVVMARMVSVPVPGPGGRRKGRVMEPAPFVPKLAQGVKRQKEYGCGVLEATQTRTKKQTPIPSRHSHDYIVMAITI